MKWHDHHLEQLSAAAVQRNVDQCRSSQPLRTYHNWHVYAIIPALIHKDQLPACRYRWSPLQLQDDELLLSLAIILFYFKKVNKKVNNHGRNIKRKCNHKENIYELKVQSSQAILVRDVT